MPARRRALAVLALLALVGVGACGSGRSGEEDVGGEPAGPSGPPAEWESATVALPRHADVELRVGVDGDRIVMLSVSEEGALASAVTDGDGPFVPGEPLDLGASYPGPGGLVRFDDAWWAVGSGGERPVATRPDDTELVFEPFVVRSTDGSTWTEVDATGIEGPASVTALAATDDGLVALGQDETANVEGGGFDEGFPPLAWRSDDGTTWEPVDLQAGDAEWGPSSLVAVDGGLLAVGGTEQGSVAWRSTDGGRTWSEAELTGLDGLTVTEVVPAGDALLASGYGGSDGEEGTPAFARSTDGGRTWSRFDPPPADHPESFGAPLFVAGDRVLTLVSTYFEAMEDPAVCYADIAQCRQDSTAVLYEGDGRGDWSRIDLAALDLGEYEDVHGAVATEDRLVLWAAGEDQVRTWSTPSDARLPAEPEPGRARADVVLLPEGEEPEVGVRYAQPLYIHCGMDWLFLGTESWERTDDGPDVETGAGESPSGGWPVAGQAIYGYATLVDADTVEYSLPDGEVIATYGPPTVEPPGCD